MELHENQKTIARDTHRFRVLCTGRRFGKTVLAIEEMIGVAIAGNDRRVAYYAPTRDDARDIAWGALLRRCEPIIAYQNDSRLELRVKTAKGGESLIVLYGWESVQERGKGRGLANDFIVFDEVAQYRNFWQGWDETLSPTLIDRKGGAMFISTPFGFNHFYDLYNLHEKNPDFKSFHFTTYDNPHIPKEEVDRERMTKTEDGFSQEYLADFRKQTGLVYKEFSREKHVTIDLPKVVAQTVSGIDWGFTNPASSHRFRIDADNHYWIDMEFYKTGQTTEQIIEAVKLTNPQKVYPDPAEPDRIEMATRYGLNCYPVSKDIEAGIEVVREALKQGRVHIHPDCLNLISELETYHYPDNKTGINKKELPVKENDHSMDEIRYVIYSIEKSGVSNNADIERSIAANLRNSQRPVYVR